MKLLDKEPAKSRLQVFLSHSGVCSRRRAMDLILEGHVSVNGQIVREPSTPVDPAKDKVSLDGVAVGVKTHEYILLNKPAGYVTTVEDPHAQRTVMDLVPKQFSHLYPVGRLDKDTEGLLLLTNDGDVAYKLTHPKFNIDKTYVVVVRGKLKEGDKMLLEKGVMIDTEVTAPAKITQVKKLDDKTEFAITIHEGRKRQIRVMLGRIGYTVLYLQRIKQGPLSLGELAKGQWRALSQHEVAQLVKL